MARFDFYVIERQLAVFALLAGTLAAVFWVNLTARGFSEFFSNTQAVKLLLHYVLLKLPYSLFQSLILAAYAAAVFVAYRLFSDQEMQAMQSAGASPARLMRPFAGFGILMAFLASVLTHEILPDSRTKEADIRVRLQADISQFRIKPGKFLFPADGVVVFVGGVADSGEYLDVFIQHGLNQDNESTHFAKTALMVQSESGPLFEMRNGITQIWDERLNSVRVIRFESMRFNLSDIAQELTNAPQIEKFTATTSLLNRSGQYRAFPSHNMLVEIHRRIIYSLTAFLFPVIGAAAVAAGEAFRIRRFIPVSASFAFIVSVYLLGESIRVQTLASGSAVFLMYLPAAFSFTVIFAMIGIMGKPPRLFAARLGTA